MTKAYKVDSTGLLIEEVESELEEGIVERVGDIEGDDALAEYLVTVPMKERFYAPRFDFDTYSYLSEQHESAMERAKESFDTYLENYEIGHKLEMEYWNNPQFENMGGSPPPYDPPYFIPLQPPDYSKLWSDTKTRDQIEQEVKEPPLPPALTNRFDSLGARIEETNGEQNYTQLALADMYEQLLATQEALNRLLEQNKSN